MKDIREVAGFFLITAGLVAAYFFRADVTSPWLWGGLVAAAVGIYLVGRALVRRKPDPYANYEEGPLDGLEFPDSCHRHHSPDGGADDLD